MSGPDLIARGLAGQARRTAQPLAGRALGNIGTRIFGGRMANAFDNTTANTFESLMTVTAPFDAVRLILGASNNAGGTASAPTVKAYVAVAGDPSDATIGALAFANYSAVMFGGAATGTLAPGASNVRRGLLVSDWIPLPSVPRTDGGMLPVLVARAYLSGGATLVLNGITGNNWGNWATHPSGRIWKTYRRNGDWNNGNQDQFRSGATQTTNGLTPIIGVQYLARGRIVNVFGSGDSITEGAGSTYIGEGFIMPACVALSTNAQGIAYEYSDLGWSGTNTAQIRDNTVDAVNAGLIGSRDIMMLPAASPNDISTTIVSNNIIAARGRIGLVLAALQGKNIETILWPWLPTNTAVKAYGSTDSLRRAYNDEVRGWAGRGAVIADLDAAIAGIDDGTGQIQMKAGSTTDGIHPNDAGNALLSAVLGRALAKAVQPAAGTLSL